MTRPVCTAIVKYLGDHERNLRSIKIAQTKMDKSARYKIDNKDEVLEKMNVFRNELIKRLLI